MLKIISAVLVSSLFCSMSYANQGRMKLIVFLDKSSSMTDEIVIFSDLAELITDKLESRCSEFSVAISELEYGDKPNPVGIVGFPAFVTEEHVNPVQALKDRILADLPVMSCNHKEECTPEQADHVGIEEYTYSSIVSTLQINQQQIFNEPISNLFTLILTDAAPVIEPYSVDAALQHINSFIPLNKFSSTSISHTNWDNPYHQSCSLDIPGNPYEYTQAAFRSLDTFVTQAHGMSLNVCNRSAGNMKASLEAQVMDFLNDIILRGCLLTS